MKKFFKKFGSLLFCSLPMLLAIGIQVVLCIPFTFYYVIIKAATTAESVDFFTGLMESIMSMDFQAPLSLLWGIISGAAALYWLMKAKKQESKLPLKKVLNPMILVGVLLLTFGMYLCISYACVGLEYLHPEWFATYNELMGSVTGGGVVATIIFILYAVIIGPIHEELVFRGVTLHYANKAFPFWFANFVQAFFFGLMHMNLVQGIYAFLAGLFLGYVYKEGRSLLTSIILHILFNAVGSFIMLHSFSDNVGLHFVVCGIGAVIALFGLIVYRTGIRNRDVGLEIK